MSEERSKPVARSPITDDDVLLMIQKLSKLGEDQKILNLRQAALTSRIDKIKKELEARCRHENVDETSWYYGGSYDEVARTFYSHKCLICGATLKKWDRSHGYYG